MKAVRHIVILLPLFLSLQLCAQTINKVEYFIDADPGFGNATNVSTAAATNITGLLIPADISALTKGFHNLFVRSRDDGGKWSLSSRWMFVKEDLAVNANKLEYFVDTDPGFGNGTNVPVTPGTNIADLAIPVDISALSRGFHAICLRSKDDAGSWSLTNCRMFVKEFARANVNKAEYFVDTDPGFGNATDVPVAASLNISNVAIPIDISSLSRGMHAIYLRTKDLNGTWSLTNRWIFFRDIAQENVQAGEYFFDTDPGFGSGTAIPFGGGLGTNVADFSFGAGLFGIPNGIHYLFVRTREVNGKWSLTNVIQFDKNEPLPVKLIYFNAMAEGKKAHLNWQTGTEQNSDRFDIERSADGLHFEKIGWVKAAGNSTSHVDYSYFDLSPKKGINYYRLKEVDIDNSLQYSEIKSARFGEDTAFALYNNPTNGSDLKITVNILPSVLSVFDASGRKVKEVNITTSSNSLSVAALASGTYLAVLNKDGKVIGVERFIVSR